jgi:hypothetical protein
MRDVNTYDQDLGRVDQRGTDDDLDLLTTRETADFVVLSDIRVQTDLLEQLPDGTSRKISSSSSLTG